MRIIGGKARGTKLYTLEGLATRPTLDRVKEALFNILALKMYGARVLDLFAGSGALGLESLSRGAKEVVFNDFAKDSLAILKKNLNTLKIPVGGEEAKLLNADYLVALESVRPCFDIIFLDPPYRFDYGEKALQKIAQKGLLSENGIAVYERDRPFEGEIDCLEIYDERKYGKTYFTFFRRGQVRDE